MSSYVGAITWEVKQMVKTTRILDLLIHNSQFPQYISKIF